MQAVIFKNLTKHGTLTFLPSVPLAFEDADAAPYFIACGWAEATDQEPLHTYLAGEVDVDPLTRDNSSGLLIADVIQKGAASNG
jgi:hypothetical protein